MIEAQRQSGRFILASPETELLADPAVVVVEVRVLRHLLGAALDSIERALAVLATHSPGNATTGDCVCRACQMRHELEK